MTEHTSDQAREGLVSSLKGKAKEVAGAVRGNNSLTVQGIVAAYQQEQEEKQEIRREAQARAEAQKTQAEQTAENRRTR